MSHVYLSYSSQDADFVDLIEADLNERGHPVWRDTSSVGEGEEWEGAIRAALSDAYVVVVALSEQGLQSEWVMQEADLAREQGTALVVLLLEACSIPQPLREAPMVDFARVRGAQGLEQLRTYRQALSGLVQLLDAQYPVRRYLIALEDTDDRVREQAAHMLGEVGDPRATEALIQALADPDIDVRFASAEALGKLRSESALRSLVRLLHNDDDPDVRAAAAVSLGQIGLAGAVTPLIEQLDYPDRFVRQSAILALGELRATAAVQQIVHLMRNDPIFDIRQAAVRALCAIGGPLAERALKRAGIDCESLDGG